ncbi:hypothetical protein LUZ61_001513 [Rhynchospora tenuis]|uniref:Disease resistance protein At4g27190-like leucine-rich repeats domain-containing protein n=1 Tax=Rhynchospora tenuis TaxID=198213 RepID=A0AAD5ZHC9_9POAL|nr:hypothetical protein LUZ61_001513 [Rhynchospora tenuis]
MGSTTVTPLENETMWLQSIEKLEDYMVNVLVGEIRASNAEFIWNVGLGDGSGLLDFMQRMSEKAVCKITKFDHVIRISVPSISEGCDSSDERKYKAIMIIANELKIMDDDDSLNKLKNELEEETYCTYKANKKKEFELVERTKKLINKKLASKNCLVIVENIINSILDPTNKWLLDFGLPVPTKFGTISSYWVVSTSSVDAYYQSATETTTFLNHHICYLNKLISRGWHPAGIIELELFHVAKSISKNPPQKLTTTMDVLWSCLVYSQLCSSDHENNNNDTQDQKSCSYCVQQKELVNLWISEGIFSRVPKIDIEQNKQREAEQQSSWVWVGDAEPAEEILRALLSHSLLRKCTRKDSSCVIIPFPGLLKLLDLWKGYISKISNDMWVDKTWVSFLESNGPWIINPIPRPDPITTLVLRGCTRLAKFPFEIIFSLLKHLRVLDLSYSSIEQIPIPLSEMTNLKFLSLRGCTRLRSLTLDSSSNSISSPLGPLKHLEFLDLDGVSLDTIPDDVPKSKCKLRYLNLSCASIVSLSSPFFQDVSNLKELFFLGCASLKYLPPSLINLFSLETFYISESQLVSFPIETFNQMPKLCDLNLKNNQLLCSLPKLVGNTSVKSFSLSGSPMITRVSLLVCRSLEIACLDDLDKLEELDIDELPNLKSFSLSRSPITHLSLCACRSLEIVYLHDLNQLEELDLSATSIKELPEWVSNLQRLKRLHMLALPQLRRLPWHKLRQVLDVFNVDQCEQERIGDHEFIIQGSVEENSQRSKHNVGAQFFLTDARLFSSFGIPNRRDVKNERAGYFQSFFISISSRNKRSNYKNNDMDINCTNLFQNKIPAYYKNIPLIASTFKQQFEERTPLNRHVEISSTEQYPAGLENILDVTNSLSVWDDGFISSLTDLCPTFQMLLECKLRRCHHMDAIFKPTIYKQGSKLETLWASKLEKITEVLAYLEIKKDDVVQLVEKEYPLDQTVFMNEDNQISYMRRTKSGDWIKVERETAITWWWQPNEFSSLKHVHLEYCARLERIFPCEMLLPHLETLTVIHCGNLRTVFYKTDYISEDNSSFYKVRLQNLHTIQLHELPKLSHLYENYMDPLVMRQWKKLHFRGCWNLQWIPLLVEERNQKVLVDGEARQCKKLKARRGKNQLSYYDFKSPHPLAAIKEHVKNNIFLM